MRQLCLAALIWLAAYPAAAHFLEILPSADVLPEGGAVALTLRFTHPFEGGPVMEMGAPRAVGLLYQGQKTDLTAALEPRAGGEFALTHALDAPGAGVFFVDPAPYWEPAEGKYIRHYAKVVVDSYASGAGWDALVGLPAEIRPLSQPTALWTGNLFTGVVLQSGKPVPFAEIEVEFVNDGSILAPNDAYITQTLRADANGTFSYAMPFSGWWGFAALLDGAPMTAPDGSPAPLEEGALIWVNAKAPL